MESLNRSKGGDVINEKCLDVVDLNAFIGTLKKREENLIQLLDYHLKFKNSDKPSDLKQLKSLNDELLQLEKSREAFEDDILVKYSDLKIIDAKQKR